jgi:DNA-binding SARP family transcriptional activator
MEGGGALSEVAEGEIAPGNGAPIDALPRLRVRAFGSIRVDGESLSLTARDFGGAKTKQIFELLVLARPHPVLKVRLAKELWPGEQPRNVFSTLETYISVLRRKLGGEPPKGQALIVTEPEAYRLVSGSFEVDLDRFAQLHAAAAQQPDSEALRSIEQALLLVGGELFADEPYSKWVQDERDRLRRHVLDTRLDAALLALRLGDYRMARTYANDARDLGRLDERALRVTMMAAYALGDDREALDVFAECRRSLATELGVEPAKATLELHDQIARQEPLVNVLPSTGPFAGAVAGSETGLLTARPEIPVDPVAFHTLLTACTLAKVSGGADGLQQLLEEASRLRRALAHDPEAIATIAAVAEGRGLASVLGHLLSRADEPTAPTEKGTSS